jgi:hypothetical protein
MLAAAVIVVLVLAVLALRAGQATVKEHGMHKLAWRYATGHHLDGRYRTDAGWFTRGTKVLHPTGRASRWAHMPRVHRAAWRLGVPLVLLIMIVLGVMLGAAALPIIGAILLGALALAVWKAVRVALYWQHNRCVVLPLAKALAFPMQTTSAEVERVLHVPLSYGRKDAEIRVAPPDHWQGTDPQREAVARIIGHRLGGEWTTRVTRRPFLLIAGRPPEPPGRVLFAEIIELIRTEGSIDRLLIGLGTGGNPVWLDFSDEIAHLGVSVGTGGGKSSFLRFLMAQLAYWGCADFPVLDSKLVSLDGMEAIPGMRVYRTTEEQWAALGGQVADMEDRYRLLLADRRAQFPVTAMLLEEQNDAAIEWRSYWNQVKASKDPATPPVYSDLTKYMIKGRQVRKRVIGVYQMLSHSACGGIDASVMRSSYGAKALSRYSHQQWDSLTGIRPRVPSSAHPGRWVVVLGNQIRHVQVPFGTPEELCEFALNSPHRGSPPPPRESVFPERAPTPPRGVVHLVPDPEEPGTFASPSASGPEAGAGDVAGRSAAAAYLGMKPETFRKARQARPIDGEYRLADGRPAWPRDALTRWREKSRARSGGPSAA